MRAENSGMPAGRIEVVQPFDSIQTCVWILYGYSCQLQRPSLTYHDSTSSSQASLSSQTVQHSSHRSFEHGELADVTFTSPPLPVLAGSARCYPVISRYIIALVLTKHRAVVITSQLCQGFHRCMRQQSQACTSQACSRSSIMRKRASRGR